MPVGVEAGGKMDSKLFVVGVRGGEDGVGHRALGLMVARHALSLAVIPPCQAMCREEMSTDELKLYFTI